MYPQVTEALVVSARQDTEFMRYSVVFPGAMEAGQGVYRALVISHAHFEEPFLVIIVGESEKTNEF